MIEANHSPFSFLQNLSRRKQISRGRFLRFRQLKLKAAPYQIAGAANRAADKNASIQNFTFPDAAPLDKKSLIFFDVKITFTTRRQWVLHLPMRNMNTI